MLERVGIFSLFKAANLSSSFLVELMEGCPSLCTNSPSPPDKELNVPKEDKVISSEEYVLSGLFECSAFPEGLSGVSASEGV